MIESSQRQHTQQQATYDDGDDDYGDVKKSSEDKRMTTSFALLRLLDELIRKVKISVVIRKMK